MVLKRNKKYFVKKSPKDKIPLACKWYGFHQKDSSPDIKRSGHLFLLVGSPDSGYILREQDVDRLVEEWTPDRAAEVEAAGERYLRRH